MSRPRKVQRTDTPPEVAAFIRNLEELRGATPQGKFARAIGVRPNLYSRWPTELKSLPTLKNLIGIATALERSINRLLYGGFPKYDRIIEAQDPLAAPPGTYLVRPPPKDEAPPTTGIQDARPSIVETSSLETMVPVNDPIVYLAHNYASMLHKLGLNTDAMAVAMAQAFVTSVSGRGLQDTGTVPPDD